MPTTIIAEIAAYSGEIAHPFRKHAAHFREKILVEIIVHQVCDMERNPRNFL